MNHSHAPAYDNPFTGNLTGQLPLRRALLLVVLTCFALLPLARAVTPAPDGRYPGNNTAEDDTALYSLTTGIDNTAIGRGALQNNTAGDYNTASGTFALFNNTIGNNNTATGVQALLKNTTGFSNTATGVNALFLNTTGDSCTGTGVEALLNNTTGFSNTAGGVRAMLSNTTGHDNTGIGNQTLFNNTTGSNNIALGTSAGSKLTTGSNNIDIGNTGVAGESGRIRLGTKGTQTAANIAGIYGKTVASSTRVGVMINSTGKLGTVLSSARYKENIKPMDKASEAILALKPVAFRYKEELDSVGVPQFGLIAEQVEKIDPNLVVRDEDGKVSTVRYEAVNAMLLNEFLKEHRKVESATGEDHAAEGGFSDENRTAAEANRNSNRNRAESERRGRIR